MDSYSRIAWLSLFAWLSLLVVSSEAFASTASKSAQSPAFVRPQESDSSTVSSSADDGATLSLFSPCKINLFLRILRKREDGFHDLASLFQAIGFGDTLELTPLAAAATTADDHESSSSSADVFTCNMPGVPVDSSNLVLRALQLMRDKTGVQQFYKSNLIKQCPAQAGLGGGSANAATAMWGANELMGRPATVEQVGFSGRALSFVCSFFRIILGSLL